jgi:hypothetical protein
MYADPIEPARRGGLVVTVDLLVRTVISNDVYEILDYVLNARIVSIEIDVYVICTDLCASDGCNKKRGCVTSADGYFGDQCLDSCPIYCTICLYSKWTMQCF